MNIGAALLTAQMAIACKDYNTVINILNDMEEYNKYLISEIEYNSEKITEISETVLKINEYKN